jgi:hypothetical protein
MRADPRYKPLSAEAATLLAEGKLNEAIRALRDNDGLGRNEAKRRIDAYLDQEPLLRVQIETQQRAARRRFFLWFVLVDLLITAAIIYWFFYRGPG